MIIYDTVDRSAQVQRRNQPGCDFTNHGIAVPIASQRGIVATVDGSGRNVLLVWLSDSRGCYAILVIDAVTGDSQQYEMPFSPAGQTIFASILSSDNKFYTHFRDRFVEFDPVERKFTFVLEAHPKQAMSMTEDSSGVIWAATHPDSGLISFNPNTGKLDEHGFVNDEAWQQFPRSIAFDNRGWIYLGIGTTASQIVAYHQTFSTASFSLPEGERINGFAYVYSNPNGKVYGKADEDVDDWYELYRGLGTRIGTHVEDPKPIIAGSQLLFHDKFPDGTQVANFSMISRTFDYIDGKSTRINFDYDTVGAAIVGVSLAPGGTLAGGSFFPAPHYFNFDPSDGSLISRPSSGQWNTTATQGTKFFIGAYTGGSLLEWDPVGPSVETQGDQTNDPAYLTNGAPEIYRPHDLLAHKDGKTIIMGGTPSPGTAGGGLLFWDSGNETATEVSSVDIVPLQAPYALASLGATKLIGGTTVSAGTGGMTTETTAELFIMDVDTKTLDWRGGPITGVGEYTDIINVSGSLIYAIADRELFIVFDTANKVIISQFSLLLTFGLAVHQQGPRAFIKSDDGSIYLLVSSGIIRIDPADYSLDFEAESPVTIDVGGDYFDGRIYFASGSELYSYQI